MVQARQDGDAMEGQATCSDPPRQGPTPSSLRTWPLCGFAAALACPGQPLRQEVAFRYGCASSAMHEAFGPAASLRLASLKPVGCGLACVVAMLVCRPLAKRRRMQAKGGLCLPKKRSLI